MKKLFTLTLVFLLGLGFASAEKSEDDNRYRNYSKNFIFNQDGIEFAVFPDGQFDFNYLQDRNGVGIYVNTGNVKVSFNSGYDYDRYVQYDTYGAVIQIEEIPIYYDSYGRVNQIGEINIDYRNGYINRLGNLNVYYSRPGVISRYSGYINSFNRNYVYHPWHTYYTVPVFGRGIVYSNAYRASYFPIRYSWSYHRNYWNTPSYYNGCYSRVNVRRNFYRPNQRVTYRSFERGRRDSRGRAVAANNTVRRNRTAISSGRSQVTRTSRGRSVATTTRNTGRNTTAVNTRSTSRNGRSTRTVSNRSNRSTTATPRSTRSTSRSTTANTGNRTTNRTATTRSTRSNSTERATPSRSNSTSRASVSIRSNRGSNNAVSSRSSSSRNTQARSSSGSSSRNTQARSSRGSSSSNKTTSRSSSSRSNRRG